MTAAGPRVLLLVPARTYRAADFLAAAGRMGLELVIGSDGALPLGGGPVIRVRPGRPAAVAAQIAARCGPVAAVVAADTPMLLLAAAVAERLGLPHNPPEAVRNAADKARQRQRWAAAGVAQPRFAIVPAAAPEDAVRDAAAAVGCPCVVKAVSLSASQGILRAGGPAGAVRAARRIRQVLGDRRARDEPLLIEEYLPGPELSIDGLLDRAAAAASRSPPSSTSRAPRTAPPSRKPCWSPRPGWPRRSWPRRSAPPGRRPARSA